MKNITLWIPAADQPRWACVESWWNLKTPEDTRLRLYRSGPNNARYSWNEAVMKFLASGDEWMLSVHNDVVVDPDTLLRLLSWEKPLVSALIFMRVGHILPHIWRHYDDNGRMAMRINDTRDWFYNHKEYIRHGAFTMQPRPDDALVPVDFTSTSCTLIHREVFDAMVPFVGNIWFKWDNDYTGGGEDRNFFENAAKAGYTGYVDRSAVVGHLTGDIPTSSYDFIAWDSVSVYMNTGEQ